MTDPEVKMTIKTLARRGVAKRDIARQLSLNEGTVRYHLKRLESGAVDGRARQRRLAADFDDAIEHWRTSKGDGPRITNSAELHAWLVAEHDYGGSLRSVQRYLAERYPPPPRRTRRRVETPPGAQAQVDWGHFPGVLVGGHPYTLNAFVQVLSFSRMPAISWSYSLDLSSWLCCHNATFRQLGGIAAVLRVDNCKTAVAHGAGAWGTLNEGYRRYAETVRFHVDPCPPREPQTKGKVERFVRTTRALFDPCEREWEDLHELDAETERRLRANAERRQCPATGTSVLEAWERERAALAPLPVRLPRSFDTLVTRPVGRDGMVAFEGRQYSVPFALVGERVEVRGVGHEVHVHHGAAVVAEHPRGTDSRVLIDTTHYKGEATPKWLPPTPLGRVGQVLERLAELPVSDRPVDLYAALAEELAR